MEYPEYEWFDPQRDMIVVAGASLRTDPGYERKIANVFIHPKHKVDNTYADVAVLKLNEPLEEGDTVRVLAKFCEVPPPTGAFIRVTGWGAIKSGKTEEEYELSDFSQELRKVDLPIITDDDCRQRMSHVSQEFLKKWKLKSYTELTTATNICAFEKGHDACYTDSGGPGIYGGEVCAVVSWGLGCADGENPSVFTSIPAILPFIREMMKK